jgi:hypothetical protein
MRSTVVTGGILAFASGSEGAIKNPFAEEEKDAPAEAKFIDVTAKKEAKKAPKPKAPAKPTIESIRAKAAPKTAVTKAEVDAQLEDAPF